MKRIIIFLSFLTLTYSVFAQDTPGNLQFNRVITFSASSASGSYSTGTYSLQSFSIPVGKVWKVTNVVVGLYNGGSAQVLDACLECSASFNDILSFYYINTGGVMNITNTPLWLAPGDYSFKLHDLSNNSSGQIYRASYSAIEFNIIQ